MTMDPLTFIATSLCGLVIVVAAIMFLVFAISIPVVIVGGTASIAAERPLQSLYFVCIFLAFCMFLNGFSATKDWLDLGMSNYEILSAFNGYFMGVVTYHVMSEYSDRWSIDVGGRYILGGVFIWFGLLYWANIATFEMARILGAEGDFSGTLVVGLDLYWGDFALSNFFTEEIGAMILTGWAIGGLLIWWAKRY